MASLSPGWCTLSQFIWNTYVILNSILVQWTPISFLWPPCSLFTKGYQKQIMVENMGFYRKHMWCCYVGHTSNQQFISDILPNWPATCQAYEPVRMACCVDQMTSGAPLQVLGSRGTLLLVAIIYVHEKLAEKCFRLVNNVFCTLHYSWTHCILPQIEIRLCLLIIVII